MATHNPFAMFAPQPVGVRFENQEEGEKIILLLRAHIVTLIPAVLTTIFLVVGPIFVPRLLTLANIDLTDLLRGGRLFLITLFWYLVTFGYAFYKFVFWYFNVYLLTNERIIDFDFRGVLHKEISYATLLHIEDVEPKTVGFFGTFFNYGDDLTNGLQVILGVKAFFVLFLIFFAIFALILFRQIQLMGRSLPTVINPYLAFVAILHLGVSLALLFVVIGVF